MVRNISYRILLAAPLAVSLLGDARAAAVPAAGVVASYAFDGVSGVVSGVTDDSGHGHALRVLGGGPVTAVAHDAGRALRFPAGCCPRAILEAASDPALNPGRAAFGYGASVRLTAAETSPGANVLQKGYFTSPGGQWKLQVDGYAGRPSCVLVGAGTRTGHLVAARRSVADGRWHRLACRRTADRLSISVDGAVEATRAIPMDLTVANDVPLRIGGKGTGGANDQFHGELDDVFLTVG